MSRGKLIVLEGGDGVGKTTQVKLLVNRLSRQGVTARSYREPGGNEIAERIRNLVKDPELTMTIRAEALLMNGARAESAHEIQDLLGKGTWVVCDRNFVSTLVYQGYGRGLPHDELWRLCQFALDGLLADLTLVLDAPREVRALRQTGRPPDKFDDETHEFFLRVEEGYRRIAEQYDYSLIDASGMLEEVEAAIWAHVEPLTFTKD